MFLKLQKLLVDGSNVSDNLEDIQLQGKLFYDLNVLLKLY